MSFYVAKSESNSNLRFNSPKTWRPEAAAQPKPAQIISSPSNDKLASPSKLSPSPSSNQSSTSSSNPPSRSSSSSSILPRANSALFSSLGFDYNEDIASDDSSEGDPLEDDKFSIPSPRKPAISRSLEVDKGKRDEHSKSKTVPLETYNELKALVAEREKERDQAIADKIEFEVNSKQTQKHQLGILRDSFKKQMEEKDRKVEDLELLLSEANGGGASDTTSTAVVSLRLKIEKLEKEKLTLEGKLQGSDITSSPSIPGQLSEEAQKEMKSTTEAKAKLEAQLDKSRSEIIQLQTEKELSAKELLLMKSEIDKMLNSTNAASDSMHLLNAERKQNFELSEKLASQKKESDARVEKLEAKISSLKDELAAESSKLDTSKSAGNHESSRLAELAAENAKFADQIEEFEHVRADWEKKTSEMSKRIAELTNDKERSMGDHSARASEIERLVDSERAKNTELSKEMTAIKKERDDARSAATKISEELADILQARNSLEDQLQTTTTENKAKMASLERDLKDMQESQGKIKDLYSKQMNESSSSFEGERADLLNNVTELQAQVTSLKNAVDDKERLLREAARSTERLEQAALQKDLENREKSDQLANSKSELETRKSELVTTLKELEEVRKERKVEVERLKEELVGVQREVEKRKGEVDEMRKEVGLLKDERRNLSAGSVSERENNERERREMAAQFEKERTQLESDHTKAIKALETKYKKQLQDIEAELKGERQKYEEERGKSEEERKKEANEALLRYKKEVQELTNNQLRKIAEIEQARSAEREEAEVVRKETEGARKEERAKWKGEKEESDHAYKTKLEEAARAYKEERENAERKHKEDRENAERKRKEEREKFEKDKVAEVDELKGKYQKEVEKVTKERDEEKSRMHVATSSLNDFKEKMGKVLKALTNEIKILKHSLAKLRSQAEENQKSIPNVVQLLAKTISKATVKLDKTSSQAIKKYKKEVVRNRKLYNEIQELKGNIRVYCRVRPLSHDEVARNDENVVSFPEENIMLVNNPQTNQKKSFEFEKIYNPDLHQEAIFKDTEPLITSVCDGYNVCIFAYGQTGSGKTYTMEGTKDSPGVNLRALNELFRVAQERAADYKFEIAVSVLEIYNETIHDLLVKPPKGNVTPIKYEIKQGPNGMYVPDLTSVQVHAAADVLRVMALGAQHRATSSTNMNEHSSRSHALLSVVVTTQNVITGSISVGKLTLVDLAGSERVSKSGVTKERMTEAQNINKSLSALGDVIAALAQKNQHIPYRNSKLTYLLQDSLGGDSKTLMFVQISPSSDNVGESLCSLNFAARVRSVELGQAKKHVGDANTAEVVKMKAHIKKLEDQLGSPELRSASPSSDSSPRPVKKKVVAKS